MGGGELLTEADCNTTPTRRMREPSVMLCFRPILSLTYGTIGRVMRPPRLYDALRTPKRAPDGVLKSIMSVRTISNDLL